MRRHTGAVAAAAQPLGLTFRELAPIALALPHVVRGAFLERRPLRVRELADAPRGRADDQRAVRKLLALRDQCARADEAVVADHGVAQDRRANADQA